MNAASDAQPGLLTDPTDFAEYLTFKLPADPDRAAFEEAMGMVINAPKSIGQKDPSALMSVTTGFSARAWETLFPEDPIPEELHDFVALDDGPRTFPSTNADVFFMIKSNRIDLNFQVASRLATAFASVAQLVDDVQGFKYLDSRDMIDFVDGTENPKGDQRAEAVVIPTGQYAGGSYLVLQKYTHRSALWHAQTAEQQEGAIGRTKADDIEIADAEKTPYAHNVKSKVTIDGVEIKMLRQNRPFGNAREHGTMFVGFARSASVIETSLRQMITADDNGNYDKLLDFVDAVSGENYFIPPDSVIQRFS
jgi:putative iron-dependent peroxidase